VYPDGRVTIETPEQITMELDPAGVGSRFLALALDTLLEVVLYVAIIFLVVLVPVARLRWLPTHWAVAATAFVLFCVYWGYFAAFEILWHGQTPGKRAAGIRVVKDSGRPITAIEGIGRNLMRVVDGMLFYLVGLVSMLLSRQHKRLGDYVAGTIVIHDKRTSEVKPDWNFARPAEIAVRPELANISEQDLIVVETFLHRRLELEPSIRFHTGVRLADMIQRKSGVAPAEGQSHEDYLEAIARQVRDQARLRT
jgi:uncharacterized RDD family membrane protein YckC